VQQRFSTARNHLECGEQPQSCRTVRLIAGNCGCIQHRVGDSAHAKRIARHDRVVGNYPAQYGPGGIQIAISQKDFRKTCLREWRCG
jgi:hypothetical protein